jgi:hypothetical protein
MKCWHTGNRTEDPWHSPNTTYNCTVRTYRHYKALTYNFCVPSRLIYYHKLWLLTAMFLRILTCLIPKEQTKWKAPQCNYIYTCAICYTYRSKKHTTSRNKLNWHVLLHAKARRQLIICMWYYDALHITHSAPTTRHPRTWPAPDV